jgi:hypothetical protein
MAPASKKLTVVENVSIGFFDPITLASEIDLALKTPRRTAERTEEEAKKAFVKARSNRVNRIRKIVTEKFIADNPHMQSSDLVRQNTPNHPVCMHARLLGAMVCAIYPHGGVHVEDDDAVWIATRAPALPSAPACSANSVGEDIGDDEPMDEPMDEATGVRWVDGAGGPLLDRGVTAEQVHHQTDDRRWWTDINTDGDPGGFAALPPWTPGAQARLIICDLPHGIRLTLDPVTGLVRATDIVSYFDKRITRWLNLGIGSNDDEGTRGLAFALAADLNTTTKSLVYCLSNGVHAATWIHIQMVVNLATWCCPAFSVHVNKVVMRFHSGQLTTQESQEAACALNATMRPASDADGASTSIETAPVAASSSAHRLVRTNARRRSVRGPETVRDIPIPRHLLTATGVYIGAWGVVDDEGGARWWHLKLGKAAEQSVTMRVRSHYAERPHTFVLLFVAGCDGGLCHVVEGALKHMAARVLGLPNVGNSDEEFKVPEDALAGTVDALTDDVGRRHGDLLTLASDAPVDSEIKKYRIESQERVKKYALDQIMKISDEQARDRAIASVLRC